ncbi:hypothetical protein E2C01_009973 [Portunus trituberculatus]|uniref:Uncharacterized protein n=1 Tax=Portunus trituberculatus TaxID=210409 RepID=A0A5B7D7F1_PORTR|nr:hypothetical protein [Portunus trituberculatus]
MHLPHIHPSPENQNLKAKWLLQPMPRSPLLERTKNVPRSNASLSDDHKCLDISLNVFYINFCNICSLRCNFQSVEHQLSSTKPHLFFTKTKLSEATDSNSFSVPSCFLYSYFHSKA